MLNYSAGMSYRQSLKFPMQQSRGITLLCMRPSTQYLLLLWGHRVLLHHSRVTGGVWGARVAALGRKHRMMRDELRLTAVNPMTTFSAYFR